MGDTVDDFAGMFHKGDASIFLPYDQVNITVLIPVYGSGNNHL